jgi:hypothetical protein
VHNAVFVCSLERVGDLTRDREGLCDRHRPNRDMIRERRAFHEFKNESGSTSRLLEPVDGGDVGMVERR